MSEVFLISLAQISPSFIGCHIVVVVVDFGVDVVVVVLMLCGVVVLLL